MNFALSEEQEELRKSVRKFLEEKSPVREVRRLMDTPEGYDPAVWKQMAEQLGLQGLAIPEAQGGSGYSWTEVGIVFEEMGRALLCAPFLSTVGLAANLAMVVGGHGPEWLLGAISGGAIATVAFTEPNGRWSEDGIAATAVKDGDTYRLSGEKSFVLDGALAEYLVVAARTESGVSLFGVAGDSPGVSREALPTLDQTRKLAKIGLDGAQGWLWGEEGKGWEYLSKMADRAAVMQAAEQVGGAQKALEMAVEYAKVRIQFGRPIGSFQAIKHKCADMLVDVESAKSAAYYAMWAASEGSDELPVVASLAKAFCSDAYFHTAAENIQIHGGIGFTWEHDAHLYFKRAKTTELFLGDPTYHRELLAQRIGL